jgi:menaquinone-specific isochorismate synthase
MKIRVRTDLLSGAPDLLNIALQSDLDGEPIAWVRGNEGFIGFGEFAAIEISGEDRFLTAKKWWQQQLQNLEIQNNVHGSGTGPILFASFSFDQSEISKLIIPQVLIGKRGEKTWITWFGDQKEPAITELIKKPSPITLQWQGDSGEDWRNRVTHLVNQIKDEKVEKVVLARSIDGSSDKPINPRRILQLLHNQYPTTWCFSNSGLVGATPELLVRLSKSLVTSRVLAGTIKKTGDDQKDLALAASLARSSKDLEEHEYAVRSVADAITPLCSSTNIPESPFVLHLSNVMHLATDVTGVLSDAATPSDIFELVSSLHPSAAVCGTPRSAAAAAIGEIEGFSRGRYAGPVGWIDIRSDGEFAIALRCGELDKTRQKIRIYAGCGIVAGSDPEAEFAESQAKLHPMQKALEEH